MFKNLVVTMVIAVLCVFAGVASAAPTLPDLGVDVGAYVPVCLTALGAIIAVAIGGKFALRMVRKGLKWALSGLNG